MQPQAHRNGPAGIFGDYEKRILLRIVLTHPRIFLFEIKDMLQEHFGVLVSEITILRALKSMGCTRQVIRQIPIQRLEMMRAKFMAEISVYDPSMLVWLDESGCDRWNTIHKYGYSVRGMRPVEYRFFWLRGQSTVTDSSTSCRPLFYQFYSHSILSTPYL